MIKLGDYNTLRIIRFTDHGAYLDGGEVGEILLPKTYVEREMRPNDEVTAFICLDQQERLVATLETPLARVGDFAFLRVAWTNEHGAFLDWGLMKDLFVPFREQRMRMERGRSYTPEDFHRGQEVELLIWRKTPIGYKVIVDNKVDGMIYDNQIFEPIHIGDRCSGTVVTVREDGKLDVSLQRIGANRFRDFSETLLEELKAAGGELPFSDRSSAEAIAERFGVSKKTFKRALGTLYRQRLIRLSDEKIVLIYQ